MRKRNIILFSSIGGLSLCLAMNDGAFNAFKRQITTDFLRANKIGRPNTMLTHPGFMVSVEYPGGKETILPIDGIPLEHQFVFLKNGTEVKSEAEADSIIPIVRVEVHFAMDPRRILEINEIGPDGQSLRRTYGGR